jgi:hypothetical protein
VLVIPTFAGPRSATWDGRQRENENAEAYSIFFLEKDTMAQTYAGTRRFSKDINVSKNSEILGVPVDRAK